jgi:alkylated DNA nucleotide flippase Atl1
VSYAAAVPAAAEAADHDPDAPARPPDAYDPDDYVEAVLGLVERIPPGRVMTYGAIAEFLRDRFGRGSARRVGTIMSHHGGGVPWHRVVAAGGRLPPGHEQRSRRHLLAEGVGFRGARVAVAEHAWWPDGDT